MDFNLGYRFLLVALIVAANAFFSAVEVALISVRPSRLRQMADDGHTGASLALDLLANPERMLSAGQVGVTLASLALGWAGEATVFEMFAGWLRPLLGSNEALMHGICYAISFLSISYVHVVIGEVVPKNIAMEQAEKLAVLLAPPLFFFIRVSRPFVSAIERSAAWVSRLVGVRGLPAAPGSHSPEELRFILTSSQRHGQLDHFSSRSMEHMLDLTDLTARQVMVPRNQVVSVPMDASLDEVLKVFQENKYSRIPVYEKTPENINGIVYAKDLLEMWQRRRTAHEQRIATPPWSLRRFLRKPLVVPETKPLGQLIEDFRHGHMHMALVVDEYGTVVGLVTLEDTMEQIFGEIEDEHDVRLPPLPLDWSEIELEGATLIRDLQMHHGIELPTQAGFETLAGFLMYKLGAIPEVGQSVEHEDHRFTVMEMDRNRVVRVRVENLKPSVELVPEAEI
jgi:CBS domain containing-hemolysin-like protein